MLIIIQKTLYRLPMLRFWRGFWILPTRFFRVVSATVTAIFHFVPHFLPFFSPRKWPAAYWAGFLGKVFFFDIFHPLHDNNAFLYVSENEVLLIQKAIPRNPRQQCIELMLSFGILR